MKTVEFKYRGEGLYVADEQHWGDSYGTYVLASEAEAEIEDTRNRSCCKYPDYCDGECTCKICAPDIHITKLESQLTAAQERERVLVKELERLSVKHKESEAYYQEQLEILQNELNHCREMYKRDAV